MTRTLLQVLQWLVILVALVALAVLALRGCGTAPTAHGPRLTAASPLPSPALPEPRTPLSGAGSCAADGYAEAARQNAASLETLPWAPFHRPELGWAISAPA